MFTFGYRFKPWRGDPIATGDQILNYMDEVIDEYDLSGRIHYRHRVTMAQWSSAQACWHVEIVHTPTEGNPVIRQVRCQFLWMCQGYYRHAEGYTPEWPGMDDFAGRIVHPQQWPKPRPDRSARGGDRLRRYRRNIGPCPGWPLCTCHHASAITHLVCNWAQRQ